MSIAMVLILVTAQPHVVGIPNYYYKNIHTYSTRGQRERKRERERERLVNNNIPPLFALQTPNPFCGLDKRSLQSPNFV